MRYLVAVALGGLPQSREAIAKRLPVEPDAVVRDELSRALSR